MENDCRFRMGAFTVVYLFVFALTLKVFAQETYKTLRGVAHQTASEVFSQAHRSSNANWIIAIIALFVLALAVHLFRLYVSLEMSDSDEQFYHDFLSRLKWWQSPIEFFLRLLMIAFVSLKAIEKLEILRIASMKDLAWFLVTLYLILISWDVFMILVYHRIVYRYFLPSAVGLFGGFFLLFFARDSGVEADNIIPEMFVLIVFSLLLLGFVGYDLYKNGDHYIKHFVGKLAWIWGARSCRVHLGGDGGGPGCDEPPSPPGLASTSGVIP